MNISITGRHVEVTEAIKQHAEDKVKRIKKYMHDVIDVHIILSVEKFRHKAEITVQGDGLTLHGEDVTDDMYASIDSVTSKVETQARKHKEKLKTARVKDKDTTNGEEQP
ncbi:MAG: ribosome-associated translation inhibitor RaiA [Nitrospinota bacterium]|nr:ribosome-associated translation inhibitor RaiA [Nitrospinota bacterium]